MVTLPDALMVLYPAAVRGTDYRLEDDRRGPRIVFWDSAKLGPEPDPRAAVAAVTDAQVAEAAAAANAERRDLRADAQNAIDGNRDFLDLFDGGGPTAAQVRDQVRALTRQTSRLIRRLVQID